MAYQISERQRQKLFSLSKDNQLKAMGYLQRYDLEETRLNEKKGIKQEETGFWKSVGAMGKQIGKSISKDLPEEAAQNMIDKGFFGGLARTGLDFSEGVARGVAQLPSQMMSGAWNLTKDAFDGGGDIQNRLSDEASKYGQENIKRTGKEWFPNESKWTGAGEFVGAETALAVGTGGASAGIKGARLVNKGKKVIQASKNLSKAEQYALYMKRGQQAGGVGKFGTRATGAALEGVAEYTRTGDSTQAIIAGGLGGVFGLPEGASNKLRKLAMQAEEKIAPIKFSSQKIGTTDVVPAEFTNKRITEKQGTQAPEFMTQKIRTPEIERKPKTTENHIIDAIRERESKIALSVDTMAGVKKGAYTKASEMKLAKIKRGIERNPTGREIITTQKKLTSNYIGKRVDIDGKSGKVVGNVFGKPKVRFSDGTTKVVDPELIKQKPVTREMATDYLEEQATSDLVAMTRPEDVINAKKAMNRGVVKPKSNKTPTIEEGAKKFNTSEEYARKMARVQVNTTSSGNEIVRLFPHKSIQGKGITTNELFVQLNKAAKRSGSNKVNASAINKEAITFYESLEKKGLLKNFKKSLNNEGSYSFTAELTDEAKKITNSRLKQIWDKANANKTIKPKVKISEKTGKRLVSKVISSQKKEGKITVKQVGKKYSKRKSAAKSLTKEPQTVSDALEFSDTTPEGWIPKTTKQMTRTAIDQLKTYDKSGKRAAYMVEDKNLKKGLIDKVFKRVELSANKFYDKKFSKEIKEAIEGSGLVKLTKDAQKYVDEFKKITKMAHDEMTKVGMKVGKVTDYFPKMLNDVGYTRLYTGNVSSVADELMRRNPWIQSREAVEEWLENARSPEVADLESFLSKPVNFTPKKGFEKARTKMQLPDEWNITDPAEALNKYLEKVADAISRHKVYGEKGKEIIRVMNEVGRSTKMTRDTKEKILKEILRPHVASKFWQESTSAIASTHLVTSFPQDFLDLISSAAADGLPTTIRAAVTEVVDSIVRKITKNKRAGSVYLKENEEYFIKTIGGKKSIGGKAWEAIKSVPSHAKHRSQRLANRTKIRSAKIAQKRFMKGGKKIGKLEKERMIGLWGEPIYDALYDSAGMPRKMTNQQFEDIMEVATLLRRGIAGDLTLPINWLTSDVIKASTMFKGWMFPSLRTSYNAMIKGTAKQRASSIASFAAASLLFGVSAKKTKEIVNKMIFGEEMTETDLSIYGLASMTAQGMLEGSGVAIVAGVPNAANFSSDPISIGASVLTGPVGTQMFKLLGIAVQAWNGFGEKGIIKKTAKSLAKSNPTSKVIYRVGFESDEEKRRRASYKKGRNKPSKTRKFYDKLTSRPKKTTTTKKPVQETGKLKKIRDKFNALSAEMKETEISKLLKAGFKKSQLNKLFGINETEAATYNFVPKKIGNYSKEEYKNTISKIKKFPVGSKELTRLIKNASLEAGTPSDWITSKDLQKLIFAESKGVVGAVNYKLKAKEPDQKKALDAVRKNKGAKMVLGSTSSATGIGQMLQTNVDKYYPSGRDGIGDPMEEMIGMLKYIKARYGTPEKAWKQYNTVHEGY